MEPSEQPKYIRYQATHPNRRGTYPGIFALTNGLANSGKLSPQDWTAWRRADDQGESAYLDPTAVDPSVYDREVNPTAQS